MTCHSKHSIDPETELPTIPGDPVSQEIRDAELKDPEEKPDELPPMRD
ncbi:MAG: hypothetical protein IMF11_20285 [Proteobacteria bacterium]|nr:hypothetical protein [Pseudomonadota bacterium]